MQTKKSTSESFDESQSLQLIQEMIQVSHRKIKNDGILFIVWGWIFFITYFFCNYLPSIYQPGLKTMEFIRLCRVALPLIGIGFTLYYLFKQRKRVTTYIGISLRYVWIALVVGLILVNLIQFNILEAINFELQHPIFMVFIAFAIVVTGGILRFKLIIAGGILFAILAYVSSYLPLQQQILLEAIAWLLAFVIPGHILYFKRKS